MGRWTFNRNNVRKWMASNLYVAVDDYTGEVIATHLAEEACGAFDMEHEDGPLDDESHWVWDLAISFVED